MGKYDQHPTVQNLLKRRKITPNELPRLSVEQIIQFCLDAGADDAGLISIHRPELDDQREDIIKYAPWTKSLLSFVCRMNREPVRSPARSVANLEFHHTGDHVNEVACTVVSKLEQIGIQAVNPSMGFPMEMDEFPGKTWIVSHKPVAVAAGLGKMGIHRNVIHPRFGNFILLGTILLNYEIKEVDGTSESQPIEYNPCLSCKLCVAACPVGAISPDGAFDFQACYTHNYREFMGGFTDWVEQIAESNSRNDYRDRVSDSETASMWASLSFGANYKAAYCMAVCPAGEEVIAPWLDNPEQFLKQTVKPLQNKTEPVYVIAGSDAAEFVEKRYPYKQKRFVRGSLHPKSIDNFLKYMQLTFQSGQAKDLTATYHFVFRGKENREATIKIDEGKLTVSEGLTGEPQLKVIADSQTWLKFLAREIPIAWALLTLRIRLKGSPKWLMRFGKCFPS